MESQTNSIFEICSEFWFYHDQEFMFTNNSKNMLRKKNEILKKTKTNKQKMQK